MQVFTLKKRRDFLKAAKEFKVVTNAVILQAALNLSPQPFPCCFVGYTATKKLGKAYIRNKTKRRLRAAVSIVFPSNALNGVNYVIIGRHNTNTLNFNYLVKKNIIIKKNRKQQTNNTASKRKSTNLLTSYKLL